MSTSVTKKVDLKFPDPAKITETGYYEVTRTVDGVEDVIQVLFWSNKDIAIAEENAKKKVKEINGNTPKAS